MKTPRTNKTKAELLQQAELKQKIERMVSLVKLMWPFIESQKTIYDTQTVFNALGGYIELGLKIKDDDLKIKDLDLVKKLAKEEDSEIKTAMINLVGLLELESARETMTLVRKVADHIGQFGATEFVKGPMTNIKLTDIVQ